MKTYGECPCGGPLLRPNAKQCRVCAMKEHPGSSQCPFCLGWYYTHSGQVVESTKQFHASRKCR
jgi:hypothetical protein